MTEYCRKNYVQLVLYCLTVSFPKLIYEKPAAIKHDNFHHISRWEKYVELDLIKINNNNKKKLVCVLAIYPLKVRSTMVIMANLCIGLLNRTIRTVSLSLTSPYLDKTESTKGIFLCSIRRTERAVFPSLQLWACLGTLA